METLTKNDTGPAEPEKAARRIAGQDPAKRQQILDGAKRVFTEMGFDAASMNDITREAGVSKGTIYVYFKNKEELFVALVDQERQELFADKNSVLIGDAPLKDKLTRYGRVMAGIISSHKVIRAMRNIIGISERMPEMSTEFYCSGPVKGNEILSDFLAGEVAAGRLFIDDYQLAAYQFVDLCMSGIFRARLFSHMSEPPTQAHIDSNVAAAVDMFLSYYGKPRAKA